MRKKVAEKVRDVICGKCNGSAQAHFEDSIAHELLWKGERLIYLRIDREEEGLPELPLMGVLQAAGSGLVEYVGRFDDFLWDKRLMQQPEIEFGAAWLAHALSIFEFSQGVITGCCAHKEKKHGCSSDRSDYIGWLLQDALETWDCLVRYHVPKVCAPSLVKEVAP